MLATATQRADASSAGSGSGQSRKVLLVDDHELVRFGVKTLYTELQGVRIDWLEASSLQEALDIYTREGTIDAVLLSWCAILKRDNAYTLLNVFWVLVGCVGIARASGFAQGA